MRERQRAHCNNGHSPHALSYSTTKHHIKIAYDLHNYINVTHVVNVHTDTVTHMHIDTMQSGHVLDKIENPDEGADWGDRGTGRVSLPSRLGLGRVVSSPARSGGGDPAGNAFWRILKATELSYNVHRCFEFASVSCHIGGKAEFFLGGNCPVPQRKPPLYDVC